MDILQNLGLTNTKDKIDQLSNNISNINSTTSIIKTSIDEQKDKMKGLLSKINGAQDKVKELLNNKNNKDIDEAVAARLQKLNEQLTKQLQAVADDASTITDDLSGIETAIKNIGTERDLNAEEQAGGRRKRKTKKGGWIWNFNKKTKKKKDKKKRKGFFGKKTRSRTKLKTNSKTRTRTF